jgi:threonine dehydrogenase-like Zn-dependent dehydrogenase
MATIPETMLAWPLFGAGMEKLGRDGRACTVPVPRPGPDELLVRIDAIGLCFSDVKLIRAGEAHPRVVSPDLATAPVIPGHEAVMTVVQVGERLRDRFAPGGRFIIQADIYVGGQGFAYGYAIDGGMAQYSRIDQRVLNGDEGCYLLPIAPETPAAIAALIEPWTCVIASYLIEHRREPLAGGRALVAMRPGDATVCVPGDLLARHAPAEIVAWGVNPATLDGLRRGCPGAKITVAPEEPSGEAFDDLFLCSLPRGEAERLARLAARNAVVNLIGDYPDEAWSFDLGSIHYRGWFHQGAPGHELGAAYGRNVRSALKRGGSCWLPGGAGAMGQMHTQLAVEAVDGPTRILVSDLDDSRIAAVRHLLAPRIRERGIVFETLNPKHFPTPEAFAEAVANFAPEGFDDIVMLVPVIPVVNAAARHLGRDGLMNIFAGIPAGQEGSLDVGAIVRRGARFIGSSGSLTAHLRHTLSLVEAGRLDPSTALAAVGGMHALKEGLEGVASARFPGKTVIFPNCPDLPLTPVADLAGLAPGMAATLGAGGAYTLAAEQCLTAKFAAP